jgi:ketosteroid isomerase-like protein
MAAKSSLVGLSYCIILFFLDKEHSPMRLITILSIVAGLAMAADKSAEGVKAAEKAWASATATANEAALKQILADDLTYTHSTGDTDSKTVFIDNMKTGARKYHKVNHDSMDVRMYGNTAVVTATAQVETSQKGGSVNPAHLRFIHVWVFQNGHWRLVAHQSQRMAN